MAEFGNAYPWKGHVRPEELAQRERESREAAARDRARERTEVELARHARALFAPGATTLEILEAQRRQALEALRAWWEVRR